MSYSRSPSYLWRHSSGLWYVKRPIPPSLRRHYLSATGKPRGHLLESLGTHNRVEAERLKRPRLAAIEEKFTVLAGGGKTTQVTTLTLAALREEVAEARAAGNEAGADALMDSAQATAEMAEGTPREASAMRTYRAATTPEKATLKEALAKRHAVTTLREQTKVAEVKALADLLLFLEVEDCLPGDVTPKDAEAFVDHLNASASGYATNKGKLSCLNRLWRTKPVKQHLPAALQQLWAGHELRGKRKSTSEQDENQKRPWRPEEIVRLFNAPEPEDERKRTYTRGLFRELYTLGLLTGMRLDEITSLRPLDIRAIDSGIVVNVRKGKKDASLRTVPMVHKAGVAILTRRAAAQPNPSGSLFPECSAGGYDNKSSWHVQKALTIDRKRLGFTRATDFHSTRRSLSTVLENTAADVVASMRYVGHSIPTLLHTTYSGGAELEMLLKVAEAIRYPSEVEALFTKAAAALTTPE